MTSQLFTYQSIHKKCFPIQWQGQLLLRPEEYFPGELPGEEDCDGSGQERRNTSNSHSSIRMEDTLLARSFCQFTSLQQLVKHCIYLMKRSRVRVTMEGQRVLLQISLQIKMFDFLLNSQNHRMNNIFSGILLNP